VCARRGARPRLGRGGESPGTADSRPRALSRRPRNSTNVRSGVTSIRKVLALGFLLWPVPAAFAVLRPIALSDGWPIHGFELNESGSVLFAGGNAAGLADGLVLVTRERMVRIASAGDPVPGMPEHVFLGFSGEQGSLALNDRDEAAFVADHCSARVE